MVQQNTRYVRNQEFVFRIIMEDTILVPIHENVADLNSIYTLNEIGSFLWEQLAQPIGIDDLEQAVLQVYEVSPDQVTEDVKVFLTDMIELGALRKVE